MKWISQRSSEPLFWVRVLAGAPDQKRHLHGVFVYRGEPERCFSPRKTVRRGRENFVRRHKIIRDHPIKACNRTMRKVYRSCKDRVPLVALNDIQNDMSFIKTTFQNDKNSVINDMWITLWVLCISFTRKLNKVMSFMSFWLRCR